jgi:hypothetical protein
MERMGCEDGAKDGAKDGIIVCVNSVGSCVGIFNNNNLST